MITQTKTKEAYLTQAQFDAKQQAGTLTPYEPYNIEGSGGLEVHKIYLGGTRLTPDARGIIRIASNGTYWINYTDIPSVNEIYISTNTNDASLFLYGNEVVLQNNKYINFSAEIPEEEEVVERVWINFNYNRVGTEDRIACVGSSIDHKVATAGEEMSNICFLISGNMVIQGIKFDL